MDRRRALMGASGGSGASGKLVNTIYYLFTTGDIGSTSITLWSQYLATSVIYATIKYNQFGEYVTEQFPIEMRGTTYKQHIDNWLAASDFEIIDFTPKEDDTYIYELSDSNVEVPINNGCGEFTEAQIGFIRAYCLSFYDDYSGTPPNGFKLTINGMVFTSIKWSSYGSIIQGIGNNFDMQIDDTDYSYIIVY